MCIRTLSQKVKNMGIEPLPNIPTVQNVPPKAKIIINKIDASPAVDLNMNITHEELHQSQQRDQFGKGILDQVQAF